MGIDHFEQMITFIYVANLVQSKFFYEEIMKFRLRLDQGECRIVEINQGGGGLLGYCTGARGMESKNDLIITLVTSSVDEWYAYLLKRGILVPDPPIYNEKFKIYHFFFHDPDGYKLEIQEFRDPAW